MAGVKCGGVAKSHKIRYSWTMDDSWYIQKGRKRLYLCGTDSGFLEWAIEGFKKDGPAILYTGERLEGQLLGCGA